MSKTNLLIDASLLLAFLAAMEPRFTGVPVHEWLSAGMIVVIITHLLLHWRWITTVGVQFFKKLWHTSRLKFVIDILLFVAFVTIMLSGFMISHAILPALGVNLMAAPVWKLLHKLSADAAVLLVGLHFALNWKWVVNSVRRYVIDPLANLARPVATVQPVAVPISRNER